MTAGNLSCMFLQIFLGALVKRLQCSSVCQRHGSVGISRKQQKRLSPRGRWEEGNSTGIVEEEEGSPHPALSRTDKRWTSTVCPQILFYETPAGATTAVGSSGWLWSSSRSLRYVSEPGCSLWPAGQTPAWVSQAARGLSSALACWGFVVVVAAAAIVIFWWDAKYSFCCWGWSCCCRCGSRVLQKYTVTYYCPENSDLM